MSQIFAISSSMPSVVDLDGIITRFSGWRRRDPPTKLIMGGWGKLPPGVGISFWNVSHQEYCVGGERLHWHQGESLEFGVSQNLNTGLCIISPRRQHKSLLVASASKPYKLKTHKSSARRFKITGTGKIMRRRAGMRHLLSKKSKSRKRRLSRMVEVKPCDYRRIMRALPYAKIKKKGTREKIARMKRERRQNRLHSLLLTSPPPPPPEQGNLHSPLLTSPPPRPPEQGNSPTQTDISV